MTKQQATNYFLEVNNPFCDYYAMQLAWQLYIDDLCMSDAITQRQRENWTNPCTPRGFKKFNKKFTGGF